MKYFVPKRSWNSILLLSLFLLFFHLSAFASPALLLKAKPVVTGILGLTEKASGSGLFIVQWKSPIQEQEKEILKKHGVIFLNYVPHQAFLVKVDNLSSLPKFSFVDRWVPYKPDFKLEPAFIPSTLFSMEQEVEVVVEVVPGEDVGILEKYFSEGLHKQSSHIYRGKTFLYALSDIAREKMVIWIERYYPLELLHLTKKELVGRRIRGATTGANSIHWL